MTLPPRRSRGGFMLSAISDPATDVFHWNEEPSVPLVRELLRRHIDLPHYAMAKFTGTKAQRSALWSEYRNFISQAISYFDAAVKVPDRSACLLLYYSLLNFAKAELTAADPSKIIGKRIGHGLSFNPVKAKKISSDSLLVQDGVFRLLYEKRVGRKLDLHKRLPIARLLRNIPEIATQLQDVNFTASAVVPLFHQICIDASSAWSVLMTWSQVDSKDVSGKLFHRVFQQVQTNFEWRQEFAISPRVTFEPVIYESREKVLSFSSNLPNITGARALTWQIKDILSPSIADGIDGQITPSLYASTLLPMPASLARYATIYYASSLVRYRPSIFDARTAPENSYLFDAIARECALPLLVDALSALEGRTQVFVRSLRS
jgi:YaaC-like Protein